MIHDRSALELADLLRRREVSSEQLVRASLDRIGARDGELAAFVDVAERSALRQARRADARRARGGELPPFLGVPTAIKDNDHVRGRFTRFGSEAFRWLWSPVDGYVARACRRAGFVLLGKLAASELTILPFIDVARHPPTRNPFDLDRYGGGSSGGSAVAVASGMIPIAPASDGGGSIRIPAAFCGLVGFKAGRGTVPNPYAMVDAVGISTIGPLARTVRDAAALLDVLAGTSGAFAEACDAPIPHLRAKLSCESPLGGPVDPEIEAATVSVARRIESLGHVVETSSAFGGEIDEFLPIMARLIARVPMLPGTASKLQPSSRWIRERGRTITGADAAAAAERLSRRVLAWFGDADIAIVPTVGQPPPRVGSFAELDGEGVFRAAAPIGAFTAPFNVSGQPAVSLPLARSRAGLPIGVQLVGAPGRERLLFALAAVLMGER